MVEEEIAPRLREGLLQLQLALAPAILAGELPEQLAPFASSRFARADA